MGWRKKVNPKLVLKDAQSRKEKEGCLPGRDDTYTKAYPQEEYHSVGNSRHYGVTEVEPCEIVRYDHFDQHKTAV